jgi:lipid-A-disaccharide synthase
MATPEVLISAGEASGDLHAGRLLTALRGRMPSMRAFGLGGDELIAAGMDALAHSSEISVVGISEVLKILPRARQIYRQLLDEVERRQPAAAILVDFPDFNLRLAKDLDRRGVRVFYYISPQVWAWRRRRVKAIARHVETMLVLFPFETDFYRRSGVDVVHVGHPLIDEVPRLEHVLGEKGEDGGDLRVVLLPGSRRSEVRALLPTMLEAARILNQKLGVEFSLLKASTVRQELLDEMMADCEVDIEIFADDRFRHMAGAHLALCASGTATLELGLMGTPMVVVYRIAFWSYLLARMLVRVEHAGLVNLVLGRRVVPELLQKDAKAEKIAARAEELLRSPGQLHQTHLDLLQLRERLGRGGATERAAQEIAERLGYEPLPPVQEEDGGNGA